MNVKAELEKRLKAAFDPSRLEIEDDSHQHTGHAGNPGGRETHFRVVIVSEKFKGLSRVKRHRLVYQVLGGLIGNPIHAIGLETHAPGEV